MTSTSATTTGNGARLPPAYTDNIPHSSDVVASGGISSSGNAWSQSQTGTGSDNFAFDSKEQEAIAGIMNRHNPAFNATPAAPVIYVIRSPLGQEQMSMPTSSAGQGQPEGQQIRAYNDISYYYRQSFIPHITLACLVFWLFGIVFGLIAFILALIARRRAAQSWGPNNLETRKQARDIGRASYIVSVVGIIVGCIVVLAVVIVLTLNRTGPVCNGLIAANGKCYNHRSQSYTSAMCGAVSGSYYDSTYNYCYFNTSADSPCPDSFYYAAGSCYLFTSPIYSESTCSNIGGYYTNYACYYNSFNCSTYTANGQCYRFVSMNYDEFQCSSKGGYFEMFICYFDNCGTGYRINNNCYDYTSTQYDRNSCDNVGGYYTRRTCYYSYNCLNYQLNGQCYRLRSDSYTEGTCSNIGGYYTTDDYGISQYCYYNVFNCSQHSANGQCYLLTSNSMTVQDCNGIADSYYNFSSSACYYNCMTMMTSSGACYQFVSSTFTPQTCSAIGGYYQTSSQSCYYMTFNCSGPNAYPVGNQCYTAVTSSYTCSTCGNLNGYFSSEQGSCYYYQGSKCIGKMFNGQCYTNQTSSVNQTYCVNSMSGSYSSTGLCYYTQMPNDCPVPAALYINCVCYNRSSTVYTPDSCRNVNGYYDNATSTCFYSLPTCPYYAINHQCYLIRSTTMTLTSCNNIGGYSVYELLASSGTYAYVCYYSSFICKYPGDDGQCYLYVSTAILPGTCANIYGYYSYSNSTCLYNSLSCSWYPYNGQCYSGYTYYTQESCNVVSGYYVNTTGVCYYWFNCYNTYNSQCYRYVSSNFTCSSCRAVGGVMSYWGACYYNRNCTYFFNQQCYGSVATVSSSASCNSLSTDNYYSPDNGQCYYRTNRSWCSAAPFTVDCDCFLYRSNLYTPDSCININGSYSSGYCYYNSSYCGSPKYSVNGQCYSSSSQYVSQTTCQNIGGFYVVSTSSSTPVPWYTTTSSYGGNNNIGTCYYTTWNCSGYSYGSQCYTYVSWALTSATCNDIGGYYAYNYVPNLGYDTYVCYYNTLNCPRFSGNGQCYSYSSTTLSRDSCNNMNGYYNSTTSTCYYSSQCGYYQMNGQCYTTYSSSYSCETCQRFGGYYNETNSLCYYSTSNCAYYVNRMCYENVSTSMTYMQCAAKAESYWSDSDNYCYFNTLIATKNCTTGYYYQKCKCYPSQSSTFTSSTCSNIRGYYNTTNNFCYYSSFNCSTGYSVNGQCYTWMAADTNATWCYNYYDNYYDSYYSSVNNTCFYSGVCLGYYINGQCYSSALHISCSSCANIGGYYNGYTCYVYTKCPYYQVYSECYTNRTNSLSAGSCSVPGAVYNYNDGYCYYTLPANCTSGYYFNCICYYYNTTAYNINTCNNIGGYYYYSQSMCYYNSTTCRGYWFGSQCYLYRYTASEYCNTVYDATTGYCYYN